jgi:hypothetical protein
MVRANRVERVYEFEHPLIGTNITESYKARYDFVNQLEYDEVKLEKCDDAGNLLRSAFSRDTPTYFSPREPRSFLEVSGFEIISEQGSLLEPVPISAESSDMMVFVCRKDKGIASHSSSR